MNHTKESNPEIIGDVYIHPSANIHPSAVVSSTSNSFFFALIFQIGFSKSDLLVFS